MKINNKDIQLHTFEGGMDSDTAPELMPANRARYMLNVRSHTFGQIGVITNIKGNEMVSTPLPSGDNQAHGWGADEENNKFYFAVYNSLGYHTIFMYDELKTTVVRVLQSITDSNGVDILHFNKDYLINHIDIVANNLFYFVDGYNKAGKFNIAKALDKSSTGYGLIIFEDFIRAYKRTVDFAPTVSYITDTTRNSNFLYGRLFKFAVRPVYDDGEKANWSDWSLVALPPNQSYSGNNTITYDNNCIQVQMFTGSQLVVKLEVAMQVGAIQSDGTLPWVVTAVLDKKTSNIPDNSTYTFNFYNDGSDVATDQEKVYRQNPALPDRPFTQAFVKNALTYANFFEGFDTVNVDIKTSVAYQDLYLPDGTASVLNNPAFTTTLITNGYTSGSLGIIGSRRNVQEHFVIGFDVKKGNIFQLYGQNGQSANYTFIYEAKANDTAISVANLFKSWIRGIGRGVPNGPAGGISNESIDGSGNVSWDHTFLGFWNEGPVVWRSSVNPVNYAVLKDNGLSIPLIKPGSTRKYAIAYEDDDGRKSLAYTSDGAVVRSGFITEVGELKQAVHTIEIHHQPPAWARYYYLLRTADSGHWIQMLIQQVIPVNPDATLLAQGNSQKYLDLVVGSLFTYQKLHPNTVLVYDFQKQDRLRLIKYYDTNNQGILYPYVETEVLSYSINTEETINANINTDGTDHVQPQDGIKPGYVGKSIIVQGYERTIIAVTSNQYVLDAAINLANNPTPTLIISPNYKIVDRRGILRIKVPVDNSGNAIDVKDLSLVEVYKPQLNSINGYKEFNPFGVKLEILNHGTAARAHAGTNQNQYATGPTVPAIISTINGDAYERNRELPTNNSVPGTQLIVDNVTDPNYSDFYESDLSSLGRVFPQDDGSGRKFFGSRIRYSNNYIQDTRINGLNDFDNADREDYNDPYGDIKLMRFRESRLFTFKTLKTSWIPVLQSIIVDQSGQQIIGTSSKLLNQMQYYAWEGGIGNNPESWVANGIRQYIASSNSGVFLRISGDGCDPISSIYNFDKDARAILSQVEKYGLRIFGGFDRESNEVIWAIPPYQRYIANGGFSAPDWNIYNDELPDGTTFEITQQPAHSTVSIGEDGLFDLVSGSTIGDDFFVYRATLPGGTVLPARKECFTVLPPPIRPQGWRVRSNSKYCIQHTLGWRVRANSKYCLTRNTGWRVRDESKYCIQVPTSVVNVTLSENVSPFIDGKVVVKVNGVTKVTLNDSGSASFVSVLGDIITVEASSTTPNTASSASLTVNIKEDEVNFFSQSEPCSPPPTVNINHDFGADVNKTYDIVVETTGAIVLADFDYLVLRYVWASGAGFDLDTFTGLINTGTPYDGNPVGKQGWVGYGQNPDPSTGFPGSGSRVIPYGSPTPYLNWGADNTSGSGVEAILVDLKKFIADYPVTPNPISVRMNAVWWASIGTGDITVEVVTYKGGVMTLDVPTHNFINTGGVVVNTISLPYNVFLQSTSALIGNSKDVAQMDFDKTTNTATLTLK